MIPLKSYVVSACPRCSPSDNRYAKGQGSGWGCGPFSQEQLLSQEYALSQVVQPLETLSQMYNPQKWIPYRFELYNSNQGRQKGAVAEAEGLSGEQLHSKECAQCSALQPCRIHLSDCFKCFEPDTYKFHINWFLKDMHVWNMGSILNYALIALEQKN